MKSWLFALLFIAAFGAYQVADAQKPGAAPAVTLSISPPYIIAPGSQYSPGSTLSSLTPQFTWNSVYGATGYGLYIRDLTTNTLVYPNASGVTYYPLQGTSLNMPSGILVNGHSYRWAMTSFTGSSESGQSSYLYFQTPQLVSIPSAPTGLYPGSISSPGPVISTLTPVMSWSTVNGATGYGLYIFDISSGALVYNNDAVGNVTAMTVPSGILVAGHSYRWNMRASNTAGFSGYSSIYYFQTQALNPTLTISPGTLMQNLGTFTCSGNNYTPYGTVYRFVQYPGQSSYTPIGPVTANSAGQISWSFQPTCTDPPVGTETLYAVDGTSGRQSNTATETVIANPSCTVPSISNVSPNPATGSNSSQTLTVYGSGFEQTGMSVMLTDVTHSQPYPNRSYKYYSASQITLEPTFGTYPATWSVQVTNSQGQSSSAYDFSVNAPMPVITSISPNSAAAGGAGFVLTVNGSTFNTSSVVRWNGVNLTTTALTSGQFTTGLQATVPSSDITTAGTAEVTVYTPSPGGGTSSPVSFTITGSAVSAPPVVTSFVVSPTSITVGSSVTATYAVTSDVGLARTELWRTPDSSGYPKKTGWALMTTTNLSGQKTYSGSFSDTPPSSGIYWYGMHAVDTKGGVGDEPASPGPIKVTVSGSIPLVRLISPNGGEDWLVGKAYEIEGNIVGSFVTGQIQYTTDGGATWKTVSALTNSSSAIGYSWLIPNTPSTNCKVKITVTYSGGSVSETSPADFMITEAPSSGFGIGVSIMAGDSRVSARSYANGVFSAPAFLQTAGVHGVVRAGPVWGTADNWTGNWWKIQWDSEPPDRNNEEFWSAQDYISVAPLGGMIQQPKFSTSSYTTDNPLWRNGYAPASTHPSSPKLENALGNCTWYANGRMLELGFDPVALGFLVRDAKYWFVDAEAHHIPVDDIPLVGSIAVKDSDKSFSTGHVAVVESLNPDGTITVSESSYSTDPGSNWNFLWRLRTVSPAWFQHYIHVPKSVLVLPPAISSPGSTQPQGTVVNTLIPSFTWNAVASATGYGLYIRDLTTNKLIYPNSNGTTSTPLQGTAYTLPTGYLTNGHSYRWAMTSFSGSAESPQSSYRYFQTAAAGGPDLYFQTTPSLASNQVVTGDSIRVSYTVGNQGDEAALGSTTRVQIRNSSNSLVSEGYFSLQPVGAGAVSQRQTSALWVPQNVSPGTYVLYVMLDYSNAIGETSTNDNISTLSFSVQAPNNYITVTSPAAGTNWSLGSKQQVTWSTSLPIASVNIQLSTDDGKTYGYTIGSSVPNIGSAWITVPNILSGTCKVKVSSAANGAVFGISSGSFNVSASQYTKASLIYETYPAGTVISPGISFDKSWTLSNTGTTTWSSSFQLQYVNGSLSKSHPNIPVLGNVAPGQSYSFSVPMQAPGATGLFQEEWKLVNGSGGTVKIDSSSYLVTSVFVGSGSADSLILSTLTPTSVIVNAGSLASFKFQVKDRNGDPVEGAFVTGQDQLLVNSFKAGPTGSDGTVTYHTISIPTNASGGTTYALSFRAVKGGYVDSPIMSASLTVKGSLQGDVPEISLGSDTTIYFSAQKNGALPPAQRLNVSNRGGGTLDWQISNASRWLTVDPTSGTGDSVSLTIQPNTSLLSVSGSPYADTLWVSSANASNSPEPIVVRYAVLASGNSDFSLAGTTVSASSIVENKNGTFTARGNVTLGGVLSFSVPVTISPSDSIVSGSCIISMADVKGRGTLQLFAGQFTFKVSSSGEISDFSSNSESGYIFMLGGISVLIQHITLLPAGISLDGKLLFVPPMRGVNIVLTISKTSGVSLVSADYPASVDLGHGMTGKNLKMSYSDLPKDLLSLSGTIQSFLFTSGVNFSIANAGLNSAAWDINVGHELPFGVNGEKPFFSILNIGGGIYGISEPPFRVSITGGLDFPEISPDLLSASVSLSYTFPNIFQGTADVEMFHTFRMANATLTKEWPSNTSLTGMVNLGDILEGNIHLNYQQNPQVSLSGQLSGTLQIPAGVLPGGDIIAMLSHHPFPWVISSVTASIDGDTAIVGASFGPFSGVVSVDFSPVPDGGAPVFNLVNLLDLNPFLFGNQQRVVGIASASDQFRYPGLRLSEANGGKGLAGTSPKILTQTIPLNGEYSQVILKLMGNYSVPASTLLAPDGQTFAPGDFLKDGQAGVTYAQSDTSYEALWLIKNPVEGDWRIEISDTTSPTLSVYASSLPLAVSIVQPAADQSSGQIQWVDSGSPDSATVDLYYSPYDYGLTGNLIVGGIRPVNGLNSYTWNYSNVTPGAYYIYAVIQDGHNAPKYCYSSGRILVPSELKSPSDLKVTFEDSLAILKWSAPAGVQIIGYNIRYADVNDPSFEKYVSVGNTDSVRLRGISLGRTYRFSVAAIDTNGRVSASVVSNPVNCISRVLNNPPSFMFDSRLPIKTQVWKQLSIVVPAYDADANPLMYSLSSAPSGMTIDASSGQINWTPGDGQLGVSSAEVTVSDGKGGIDSANIQFDVIRQTDPAVSLTRTYYSAENPLCIVTVNDNELVANSIQRQQLVVGLSAGGHSSSVVCTDIAANSGTFTGVIDLSKLSFAAGDTITAIFNSPDGQIASAIAYWKTATSVVESVPTIPDKFELLQNYPNPFNPTTTISYSIPRPEKVTLEIFDILGQRVAVLKNENQSPGFYSVKWNGMNQNGEFVATGVYFYRLVAGSFVSVKKMLLLK